jgi:hypothetical protein
MESYLLAGTPTGVFLSSDDGANWAPTGLMGPSVLCLMVDGSYIFAGTDDGVFFSRDTGTSWIQRNDGLHANVYVRALATDGTSLFAGLYNDGVWKRPLSEITAVSTYPQNMLPLSVELYQNYPNPFNPSTTIKFELPKASQVLLTVYNTLGQQVATLVHGQQEAGSYEVKFDGSGLASGVYFYRLQAGTYVETRKVLLLK